MRFLGRSLLGTAILAITLGLLAWAGAVMQSAFEERAGREPRGRPAQERVIAAQVVPVEIGRITPVTSAFGEVRAARSLDLRAPEGGRIVDLSPAMVEGGRVAAGEVLARIDPAEAEARLARIGADIAAADADLADAERSLALARDERAASEAQVVLRQRALDRAQDLADRGVGTSAALETAELALSSAEAQVLSRRQSEATAAARRDRAEVALGRLDIDRAEAERSLADLTIRAGFDGLVAEVDATLGSLVAPNERLGRLIDPAAIEVAIQLSSVQYARLRQVEGLPVAVSLGGDAPPIAGRIVREGAEVGEGRTGRLLFAALDDPGGLRPGDFVDVELTETPLRGVARLPATALGADGRVLVIGEGERLTDAPVDLLRRQGDEVIVRAADLAGRDVVAERTPQLGAGIRVAPVRGVARVPEGPDLVELDDDRRARLIAFVEGGRMPDEVKARVLGQLRQPMVPRQAVERIEARMGG